MKNLILNTENWNDWLWQISNRIIQNNNKNKFPYIITPYYLDLLDRLGPDHPLRKTVLKPEQDVVSSIHENIDPLGEKDDSPVRGVIHRYPDRVLFLVTNFCATHCRYCTRARISGEKDFKYNLNEVISYIRDHKMIRDVLISGGDPLTLVTSYLEWILRHIRNIDHVEIIRIGTKVPVVLPQRITKNLANMIKKYHPVYVNIHFTHPDEITPETSRACKILADTGIPLGSQTVLLKGVNDDLETMKKLFLGLLKIRVKPYYLFQCDLIPGSSNFRTPVSKGVEIIKGLRGYITGHAIPTFVIDAPGGGGKVPISPDYIDEWDENNVTFRNYLGKTYQYPIQ